MSLYLALKTLHILGATVLLGTGAGIAFFMWMAHRTGDKGVIAHTASVVVIAVKPQTAVEALAPERVVLLPDGAEDLWNADYLDLVETPQRFGLSD